MDSEKSSIERLKRTLYSRNEKLVPKERRTPVSPVENNVRTDWGTNASFGLSPESMTPKKNNSFLNKFFLSSVVFFVISLGIALFIFYGGLNMISSDNLEVEITAPSIISSGEELVIGLSMANTNPTELKDVTLFISYPTGVKAVNGDQNLSYEKIRIGNILDGKREDYTVRALVFGEKDAVKTFNFRIEYTVSGSNAVFSKEKNYEVVIGSSPLLLNLSYPKESNSGQEITLSIDVTSNSSSPIKNTLLKVEYPYGFTYSDSNIKPVRDNSTWNIGDLKNGDKKTITVKGVLIGQNDEDRSFRVSVGAENLQSKYDLDTVLATDIATIGIRKSFFDLSVSSGNNNVGRIGQSSNVSISLQNTLPDKIINARIFVKLGGNVLDKSSISVGDNGFYRSLDNTISWDKLNLSQLASLDPGDSEEVSFSASSFKVQSLLAGIENPHINVSVTVDGDRTGLDGGRILSEENIVIKFPSTLGFTSKVLRATGSLTNTGPVPPKADKETTYTISWTITNTTNNLKNVVVSASLPFGVVWKGEISPLGEKITYDENTRVIYWNIGNVSKGVGFEFSPKEVYFKIGITPSVNQVGSIPALTSEINAVAEDTYTNTPLSSSASAATTAFSDANYKSTDGVIVK